MRPRASSTAIAIATAGVLIAAASAARAAPDGGARDGGAGDGGVARDGGAPGPAMTAPAPLGAIVPVYPEAAMKAGLDGSVILILDIDAAGAVTKVEVESGLPGGLTESAVAAARGARFKPATDAAGRPTPVRIRWLIQFTLPERRTQASADGGVPGAAPDGAVPVAPPAPAAVPALEPLPPNVERFPLGPSATLSIRVREKGTGKDLPTAMVYVEDVGEVLHLDAGARAERSLAPGAYVVVIRAPGHAQLEKIERLHDGERVERVYFIEKERLSQYETIVRARPPRPETGVVTLQAEEIHNIPGTFGDPFRTAMLLPGVGSIVSGLGYPVIRGESPGQTGTFIDEIKVPLLYHLGFGPAVVHPLYLDSLDFHPGNFPAEFGRFSGALIQAHTVDPPPDPQTMLSADLFKFSAFHARPLRLREHDAAVSAAARYGTFAFLARAIDPRAVLEYWDYQLRADLKLGSGDLRLIIFGAQDRTGRAAGTEPDGTVEGDQLLKLGFHRAALRWRGRFKRAAVDAGVEFGPDYTTSTGDPGSTPMGQMPADSIRLVELITRPHIAASVPLGSKLKLRFGGDLLVQTWDVHIGDPNIPGGFVGDVFPRWGVTPGLFLQADFQPTPRWLIRPGVRFDHYRYFLQAVTHQQTGIDPRISARYEIRKDIYVKGGVGLYQSPPRFLVPWPGLEGFGLNQGLNRSAQASVGVELSLPWDSSIDGQVYGNWLPRLSEYALGFDSDAPSGQSTYSGRAYGLEIIARRRLGHRLFGWVTYTLARAERNYPGAGWRPADFDQTQIINAVASYALGRSWTVSSVFHYNGGRPFTPRANEDDDALPSARNLQRLPDFWRVDLRIEKREAFDTWYLDFYVDWLNISLQREATGWDYGRMQAETILLTIPTIGLQVVF